MKRSPYWWGDRGPMGGKGPWGSQILGGVEGAP